MRISDWSSDVCSSDLDTTVPRELPDAGGVQIGNVPAPSHETHRVAIQVKRDFGVIVESCILLDHVRVHSDDCAWSQACPVEEQVDLVEPKREYTGSVQQIEVCLQQARARSEEHTSELQSLMRISYAVFCLKKK